MKGSQFELKLENEKIITCSSAGQGPRVGFIVGGPGSFYFNGLSVLENEYTFISSDSIWTYGKSKPLEEKNVATITKESIKERDHLIIKALKKHFDVTEIDGFGFSAPGALLFEEAADYPEDFDFIIGTGIGLTELDPTFSKTNAIFYNKASPERKKAFEKYQERYQELQTFENSPDENLLPLFDIKTAPQLFKPHKQFVAKTIAVIPKLFFNYSESEQAKSMVIEHWKHNPFKAHIDKRVQEHFFNNIYPQLKPLQTLIELAKTNKNILLIYGDTDFITPLSTEILEQLHQYSTIQIEVMNDCGHVPYKEHPQKYLDIIMNYTQKGKQVSVLSQ
jgi:pimeloyl-ACP methyl ester carboxylesterase